MSFFRVGEIELPVNSLRRGGGGDPTRWSIKAETRKRERKEVIDINYICHENSAFCKKLLWSRPRRYSDVMYGFMRRTHKMQLLHMHPVFIPWNLKLCHFLFADTVNPEWVGVACLPISVLTRVTSDSQRLFSSRVHLIPVPFLSFLFYFCPSTPGFWNWVTWGRGWNLPLRNGTPTLTTRYIISTLRWFYVSRRAAVFTGDSTRRPHSAVVVFLVWAVGNFPATVWSLKNHVQISTDTHKSATKMSHFCELMVTLAGMDVS